MYARLYIQALPQESAFRIGGGYKPALPRSAKLPAERIRQFVLSTTKKLAARVAA